MQGNKKNRNQLVEAGKLFLKRTDMNNMGLPNSMLDRMAKQEKQILLHSRYFSHLWEFPIGTSFGSHKSQTIANSKKMQDGCPQNTEAKSCFSTHATATNNEKPRIIDHKPYLNKSKVAQERLTYNLKHDQSQRLSLPNIQSTRKTIHQRQNAQIQYRQNQSKKFNAVLANINMGFSFEKEDSSRQRSSSLLTFDSSQDKESKLNRNTNVLQKGPLTSSLLKYSNNMVNHPLRIAKKVERLSPCVKDSKDIVYQHRMPHKKLYQRRRNAVCEQNVIEREGLLFMLDERYAKTYLHKMC